MRAQKRISAGKYTMSNMLKIVELTECMYVQQLGWDVRMRTPFILTEL